MIIKNSGLSYVLKLSPFPEFGLGLGVCSGAGVTAGSCSRLFADELVTVH